MSVGPSTSLPGTSMRRVARIDIDYAVLFGGATAKRALRLAPLDPTDSDEPGEYRRVALATYAEYDDFLYRLPKYLRDVNRRIEARLDQTTQG